jgi:glycosyltransferase involved in cell wall biosynthesis
MKCLMVVDSYNWALYNRAVNLSKYIEFDKIDILHFNDCVDNFNYYDLVYLLNWSIHGYVKKFIKKNRKHKLIATVSSHIGRDNATNMKTVFDMFDSISCSSMFLFHEFKESGIKSNIFYTPFGVNTDIFYDMKNPINEKCFGWVGNYERPVKRFSDIKKACRSCGAVLKTATHRDSFSRSDMRIFYNNISTLICFSESEGTPNPVLEALACNRNIISTPVGNVPELKEKFGSMIKIVNTKEELVNAINSAEELKNISLDIQDISWKKLHANFVPFIMK